MEINREELRSQLTAGQVIVTFNKSTGEQRIMTCTLQESLLPARPVTSGKTRSANPDVCVVWDVNAQAWRSFRYDRVTAIEQCS